MVIVIMLDKIYILSLSGENMKGKWWIVIIFIIVIIIGIGVFGGYHTASSYYNCDVGFEGKFCLWWHQTPYGLIHEVLEEGNLGGGLVIP